MSPRVDSLAGWSAQPNIIVTTIPGSNPPITEVEVVWPQGHSTVTWRIDLASIADYRALLAKVATVDILGVTDNIQSHAGNTIEGGGQLTVDLPNTLLMGLSNEAMQVDGRMEVDATFLRQLDPVTGLSVPI